jgi:hypothetical protein
MKQFGEKCGIDGQIDAQIDACIDVWIDVVIRNFAPVWAACQGSAFKY